MLVVSPGLNYETRISRAFLMVELSPEIPRKTYGRSGEKDMAVNRGDKDPAKGGISESPSTKRAILLEKKQQNT